MAVTLEDAVRALARQAHFGGDTAAQQTVQEWTDQYDQYDKDNTPEPEGDTPPTTPAKSVTSTPRSAGK